MGVARRLIQRRHQLRKDVTDNVPGREKIEKMDKVLNDQPGSYSLARKYRRRQDRNFGVDSLDRKIELAWELDVQIARFDFGAGSYGLKVTLPSSAQLLTRGFLPGDELKILEKSSKLAARRYSAISGGTGDVAAGKVRIIDSTTWRLPDGLVTSAVKAFGSISLAADMTGADLVDTETFTLDDGTNPATVFEFDSGGGITGDVAVAFTAGDSAATIKAAIMAAINGVGAGLGITASDGGGLTILLQNDVAGAAGNVAIADTVASPKFSVVGMQGGVTGSTSFATESSVRIRVELGAGVRK